MMGKGLERSNEVAPVKITFTGEGKNECHEITDENVIVFGSLGGDDHGSSKVKLKNIVDYKWEIKNYPGHLIAAHVDGKCLAYVIKVHNKLTGTEGMVRVINGDKRALIKGMSEVLDVQFAYIEKRYILACIELHVLHLYEIETRSDSLVCNTLLEIEDLLPNYSPKFDKICWCPYIPDDTVNADDDIALLLVWARENGFQCFDINAIISSYGVGKHIANDVIDGHLKLTDPTFIVTWVALSPDGTTLSVGSDDGYIRFYQVYFHEKEPRCLHQWIPHNGKPISSFFFLDNLVKTPADAYWKHALTGAERNSEFKIWDCGTWDCLQMLSLNSDNSNGVSYIADIDRTASYLILSSIQNRVLYVIQLVNNLIGNIKETENGELKETPIAKRLESTTSKTLVFMKSISEFPISSPILSFSIIDATIRKYKCQENENFLEEFDDFDEDTSAACCVVRLLIVQPKSVQECNIIYQPTVPETTEVLSTISNDSAGNYKDALLDTTIIWNTSEEVIPDQIKHNVHIGEQLQIERAKNTSKGNSQLNLMTPESFSLKKDINSSECVSSEVLSTILMLASVTGSNNKTAENVNILNLVNNKIIEDREQQKFSQLTSQQNNFRDSDTVGANAEAIASGGSSPSREIQQIFGDICYTKPKTIYTEKSKSDNDIRQHSASVEEILQNISDNAVCKKSMDWPKVPNITHAEEFINTKPSINTVDQIRNDFRDFDVKISEIRDIIKNQSIHIVELKKDVELLKNKKMELPKNSQQIDYRNESQINKLIEDCLLRSDRQHERCLKSFITASNSQNRELRDSVNQILNQFLFNQLPEKIANSLAPQVQQEVVSVLTKSVDSINQQFRNEISQKLATIEKVFKENILQISKSKSLVEAFGSSVVIGVQNGLQNVYIQSMSETLIPAYERSSQEMFKQLHGAFLLGIKDIMEQFENYIGQIQPIKDGIKDISSKVVDLQNHMDAVLFKQKSGIIESHIEAREEFKSIEANIVNRLTDVIQQEVRKSFETQTACLEDSVVMAMRSQTQTPGPSIYEVQDQVKSLLNQGQINKAFHQALIANDLTLVEYTLEKADYKRVFNPCALEQTVLLSLIQQISADMDNHNEIKHRYLADGLLNLNQTDPITKEHAPRVLRELYKNCENYITTNPKSSLCSSIRMIMMAVQGLGYKVLQ